MSSTVASGSTRRLTRRSVFEPIKHDTMLTGRGFTAWIECDGEELECYQIERPTAQLITCWIASEHGMAFTVHWREDEDTYISTVGEVHIDGQYIAGMGLDGEEGEEESVTAVQINADEECCLKFSAIPFESNSTTSQDDSDGGPLGTIRVDVYRVKVGRKTPESFVTHTAAVTPSIQPDNKRAAVHYTSFGKPKSVARESSFVHTKPYKPSDKTPYISFLFRYRPRDRLESINVVERKADPLKVGNPFEDAPQDTSAPREISPAVKTEDEPGIPRPLETVDRLTLIGIEGEVIPASVSELEGQPTLVKNEDDGVILGVSETLEQPTRVKDEDEAVAPETSGTIEQRVPVKDEDQGGAVSSEVLEKIQTLEAALADLKARFCPPKKRARSEYSDDGEPTRKKARPEQTADPVKIDEVIDLTMDD